MIVGSTLNELTQGLGIRLVRGREERPLASSFVGLGRVRVTDYALRFFRGAPNARANPNPRDHLLLAQSAGNRAPPARS